MAAPEYRRRFVDAELDRRMPEEPAILLTGPRGCGKTTTGSRRVARVVRMDVPADAAAFRSDPDAALSRSVEPLLIDEWQLVPGVLGAVRRAVDADPRPGRFLLAGSMRADHDVELWPGTGRIARIPMTGLTEAELMPVGPGEDLLDRLRRPMSFERATDLRLPDYLDRVVRGGLPVAVLRHPNPLRWYRDYLDQFLDRDVPESGTVAEPDRLRRYIAALAENIAGTPTVVTLAQASGSTAKTIARYDRILQDMGMLDVVPAWSTNRLQRLVKNPKLYLADTGIAAAALDVDSADLLSDGSRYGRMLDAYVTAQLRPALASAPRPRRLSHLRDQGGRHEVDVLIDLGRQGVIAIEIKAAAEVTAHDARHLAWLRDSLGDRFVSGLVLHTGPVGYELGDRIVAQPIDFLWAA